MIVNNETGEIIEEEENTIKYQLAVSEMNQLAVFDQWLDAKEMMETAKERFDMVDKPFRKAMTEIFEKYSIKKLSNPYIEIVQKNGYTKTSWDDEKLKAFIYQHGADPKDFQKEKWVNGSLQMKYKED